MCSLQAKATAEATTTKSHYRGVRKRSEGLFSAVINDPSKGRRVWLGTFSSDIEAAHAYDRAAIAIKGCRAKTNFPLSGYQIPESLKEVHVPSSVNSNKMVKAASRPWTHAYLNKTFNVGTSSSPSILQDMSPQELRRQQQSAAFKMTNQPRCNESEGDGGVGEIHEGCKVSSNPCNSSDPSSSAVTECRDSPTMGVLDLNLPPPVEEDECDYSPKTLWLLK
ncbi:hypothetical protein SUGI_1176370 [Cryptomeria japonica]|uniref:ethylene-responsive transcription factor 12-like n=1 Tax=Cryptomeria japonica TaxID=3369 RepID=UPI002414B63B|nr:ethylene-responsive transcription factor 12-like [Cryptomeria japonica]GLJ54763.1 hypothetical protein SUGI_1176370 [Cryptomeria japonica]